MNTNTQNQIIDRYGDKAVQEAETRLCDKCYRRHYCRLIPICSDGSDCLYFGEDEASPRPR